MAERIYSVKDKAGNVRLVKANNKQAALRHVISDDYKVEIASQDDLVSAMSAGVVVETAGADATA